VLLRIINLKQQMLTHQYTKDGIVFEIKLNFTKSEDLALIEDENTVFDLTNVNGYNCYRFAMGYIVGLSYSKLLKLCNGDKLLRPGVSAVASPRFMIKLISLICSLKIKGNTDQIKILDNIYLFIYVIQKRLLEHDNITREIIEYDIKVTDFILKNKYVLKTTKALIKHHLNKDLKSSKKIIDLLDEEGSPREIRKDRVSSSRGRSGSSPRGETRKARPGSSPRGKHPESEHNKSNKCTIS
jgi:hypothetical protein